jgi:flagellar motor switch protein FliM
MGDSVAGGILRRMARPAQPASTPTRALRLAATRAAGSAAGLPLAVLGIAEEEGALDDLLAGLGDGLLLMRLDRDGAAAGLLALDGEGRSAAVEAQVLGRPAARAADPRPPTAADAALCAPFLDAFLAQAQAELEGSALADWLRGAGTAGRLADARGAGLALPDGRYRAMRLTLDLGAGGRQGLLLLMLRLPAPAPADPIRTPDATVAPLVLAAESPLRAVLHRLELPLAQVEAWAPGTVLPLPGVTVGSVRLEAAGGSEIGTARLGQVGGRRAIRIETPLAPPLQDIRPPPLPPPAG